MLTKLQASAWVFSHGIGWHRQNLGAGCARRHVQFCDTPDTDWRMSCSEAYRHYNKTLPSFSMSSPHSIRTCRHILIHWTLKFWKDPVGCQVYITRKQARLPRCSLCITDLDKKKESCCSVANVGHVSFTPMYFSGGFPCVQYVRVSYLITYKMIHCGSQKCLYKNTEKMVSMFQVKLAHMIRW